MEQTALFNQVVSKETVDSFGLETQNWTQENLNKLEESMTLAFKENWDEWMEDPELAYEECREQVQDMVIDERLDRMEEFIWQNDDTRDQDALIDRLLWDVGEAAKRVWEFFNTNTEDEQYPPETPQLTEVEPNLPPGPPMPLQHTRNVDGDFGMYVNSNECNCVGCREYRETETDLEEIINQYRW